MADRMLAMSKSAIMCPPEAEFLRLDCFSCSLFNWNRSVRYVGACKSTFDRLMHQDKRSKTAGKKLHQATWIERFSFECRKTKTKVITLANHKEHRQYSEPIKTQSNYM